MSDIAIRAVKLSKQYRIGGTYEAYQTLRDTLTDAVAGPFRRVGRLLRGQAYGAAELDRTIWALKDVSFEVKQGEVVGIIGPNGAGKSTLLKVFSRITEPTEGYVDVHGQVGSLLEVGTGFHLELTGRENIYLNGSILGLKRQEIEGKFDEIVSFAEVEQFIDTPMKFYSSGMILRLGFAVAAHLEPDILIVDEVLAVGDAAFQRKCLRKMENVSMQGRTVLFVSHNMAAVRNLCTRAILLDQGQIQSSGSVGDVIQDYLVGFGNQEVGLINLAVQQDNDVRIVGFQARACDGGDSPRTGACAEFIVEYEASGDETISKLFLSIEIKDLSGTRVFACTTAMTQSDFYNLPPKGQIVCQIDYLPLVPGRYNVDIKLIDAIGTRVYLENAATVEVIDTGESGVVKYPRQVNIVVPHKWKRLP